MIASIADTHSAIWYLFNDARLSQQARNTFAEALTNGDQVGLSSISPAEVVYLSEKGRIPPTTLENTLAIIRDPEGVLAEVPIDSMVVEKMQLIPRSAVPDLPDRYGVPVISRDARIRLSNVQTIW